MDACAAAKGAVDMKMAGRIRSVTAVIDVLMFRNVMHRSYPLLLNSHPSEIDQYNHENE
jgi:hypothetical protein